MHNDSISERLAKAFTYKSEWLGEDALPLLRRPNYLKELELVRPVIMTGSRGSGKTTALLFLWYKNKIACANQVKEQNYIGLYHRIDTSVTFQFSGGKLESDKWSKIFAHYINLILCDLIVEFVDSFSEEVSIRPDVENNLCKVLLGRDLGVSRLSEAIQEELLHLGDKISNIDRDSESIHLSILKTPVDLLISGVQINDKEINIPFFFMFDEFENLLDYQQIIVNTLLKHFSGSAYIKIGVRPLGHLAFSTLNRSELLRSPDDFHTIDVDTSIRKGYKDFAKGVCHARLKYLGSKDINTDVNTLFRNLTDEEEAILLNVGKYNNPFILKLPSLELENIKQLPALKIAFLRYWADGHDIDYSETWEQYKNDKDSWDNRYQNYKYAVLFAIGRGNRIRKYYTGWDTMVLLSHYNIRYLLEMIEKMIIMTLEKNEPLLEISPEIQTKSSIEIGKKNLEQIERLSVYGRKITKLMFGLGRIFENLAAYPEKRSPETNQFRISGLLPNSEIQKIIDLAVQHSGLVRIKASKLTSESDTREFEYMLHPIFSPYFIFSHRKKRKMTITSEDISDLIDNPKQTIQKIVNKVSPESNLTTQKNIRPIQPTLFDL